MDNWKNCPFVLRRKLCYTLLSGFGSLAASLIICTISYDRILLGLGSIIFIFCVFRTGALWHTITLNAYELITGVCVSISSQPFRKYRRIRIMDEAGAETTLLLNSQINVKVGTHYTFYFQKGCRPVLGNEYLDMSLLTDAFLGYEVFSEFE